MQQPVKPVSISALRPLPSEAHKLREQLGDLVKRSMVQREQANEIGDRIKSVVERITKLVPQPESTEESK